ncbi:hypothetical protein FNV43_RR19429 [Rhamnella rubrinervis]|uniref:Uncharacterized protein n=1 Tax=Rhamnella rubrinervis TaxID=2594499 RepID=A0A8K0DSN0_9ROSA|nr:hypothetical protein FNV43_RR19429 [Rhamnella rubrinervis]
MRLAEDAAGRPQEVVGKGRRIRWKVEEVAGGQRKLLANGSKLLKGRRKVLEGCGKVLEGQREGVGRSEKLWAKREAAVALGKCWKAVGSRRKLWDGRRKEVEGREVERSLKLLDAVEGVGGEEVVGAEESHGKAFEVLEGQRNLVASHKLWDWP